jgi:hypothetical protein
MKGSNNLLQLRSSAVRDEFDLSTSDNLIAPSTPTLLPVLSQNETKQQMLLLRLSDAKDELNSSASANLITPSSPTPVSVLSENEIK